MCKKLVCLICLAAVLIVAQSASADLIGHWLLDGDGTDASGNGLDGTINGNIVPTADKFDNPKSAMQFGGASGDYVDIGDPPALQLTGAMTLSAWVMLDSTNTNNARIFAKAGGSGARCWSLNIEASSGGVVNPATFQISPTGAANISISDPEPLPTDEWVHMAGVYRPGEATEIYVNGELKARNTTGIPASQFSNNNRSVLIGNRNNCTNCGWLGSIDDVRIYDHALTQDEILSTMKGEAQPYAFRPDPPDGAVYENTWAYLSWSPGDMAVSHDVYLGESFDDVSNGTGETFRGNQTASTYLAGIAGYAYPDGLVPGTTYYWRIDEVNDADPNRPWKGDVWSFTVPPRKAYNPSPADGARYVATEGTTLSWTAGMGTKLHTIYFGDNFDNVNNGAGGGFQAATTYKPGTLEPDKTYYWRVDEFDGAVTFRGDLWSFATVPTLPVTDPSLLGWWKLDEGQGATAVDWSGHANHGTLVGAPQWADGYDGGALEFEYGNTHDGVAVKAFDVPTGAITLGAWVKPESFAQNDGRIITKATGTNENDHFWMLSTIASGSEYVLRFRLKTDDGQNTTTLIADGGALTVGEWTHAAATWDGTSTVLYKEGVEVGRGAKAGTAVAANPTLGISIGNHLTGTTGSRAWDGLIDDVRVYNKALSVDELKDAMRGDVFVAWAPMPAREATVELNKALPLSWSRGDNAAQHNVYFGTDKDAVADADASDTTGVYRGRQTADSYTPAEGLEWGGGPYYWRIDEVKSDGTISTGRIWSFSVADYLIVDDIESYNDLPEGEPGSNRIYLKWIDGFGTTTNGAFVGNLDVPLTERGNVHGGAQAMPLSYENNFKFSEATLTLTAGRDWTREGVANLSLWFRGAAANAPERMYMALNGNAVAYHNEPIATQKTAWTEWVIPLQQFAALGVNLTNVTSITIGFGTRGNTNTTGGTGQMYFDDIRLYRPAAAP